MAICWKLETPKRNGLYFQWKSECFPNCTKIYEKMADKTLIFAYCPERAQPPFLENKASYALKQICIPKSNCSFTIFRSSSYRWKYCRWRIGSSGTPYRFHCQTPVRCSAWRADILPSASKNWRPICSNMKLVWKPPPLIRCGARNTLLCFFRRKCDGDVAAFRRHKRIEAANFTGVAAAFFKHLLIRMRRAAPRPLRVSPKRARTSLRGRYPSKVYTPLYWREITACSKQLVCFCGI